MAQRPWYSKYPQDYAYDTQRLGSDLEAHGLYNLMLDRIWIDGSLPADVAELATLFGIDKRKMRRVLQVLLGDFPVDNLLTGSTTTTDRPDFSETSARSPGEVSEKSPRKAGFFFVSSGRIYQKRLEQEMAKALEKSGKAAAAAGARWNADASATTDAPGMPPDPQPQPQRDQEPTTTTTPVDKPGEAPPDPDDAIPRTGAGNGRGKRWPDGCAVPDRWRAVMRERYPGLDIDYEAEEFSNYWSGVSGQRGVKRSWWRTWNNHCLKRAKWAQERTQAKGAGNDGRKLATDRWNAAFEHIINHQPKDPAAEADPTYLKCMGELGARFHGITTREVPFLKREFIDRYTQLSGDKP